MFRILTLSDTGFVMILADTGSEAVKLFKTLSYSLI